MNEKWQEKINHINYYHFPFHFIGLGKNGLQLLKFFQANEIKGEYSLIDELDENDKHEFINDFNFVVPQKPVVPNSKVFFPDYNCDFEISNQILKLFNAKQLFIFLFSTHSFFGTRFIEKLMKEERMGNVKSAFFYLSPFGFEDKSQVEAANDFHLKHYSKFNYFSVSLAQLGLQYENSTLSEIEEKATELILKLFLKEIIQIINYYERNPI